MEAGVNAAETDANADAVPLKRGLEASNAETNPLEAMIAAMTTASASVLTNRGVICAMSTDKCATSELFAQRNENPSVVYTGKKVSIDELVISDYVPDVSPLTSIPLVSVPASDSSSFTAMIVTSSRTA